MSSARAVSVSDLTTRFNFELRNSSGKQWTTTETLEYVNKWMEFVHQILSEHESDLVKTGTGSFTTSEGVELYDLSVNAMGDLLFPVKVWLSGITEIEPVDESDRMDHVLSDEQGNGAYSQPASYYLEGDNMGLLPFPDSTGYTVKIKYIPDYTALLVSSTMPFKNIFNNVLVEGVKIIAKNREEYGTAVDAAILEIFQDKAMSIIRKRQKQDMRLSPVLTYV